MRYDNPHFRDINNKLMKLYYNDAITTYNLNNVVNPVLTGGSMRRQYEYMPPSFLQSKEAEGRKLILNATNVITPSNYNYGHSGNVPRYLKGGDMGTFLKPVVSSIIDVAAPALGAYVGGPIGATLAKGAREGLRATTGWGKGKKKIAGSLNASDVAVGGAMSAGCNGNMACLPCSKKMKGAAKSAGAKSAGAKKENRMNLVKKIMKEKGLPLGAASKYIKDNNLY
jgi:hypothetical protein